MSNKHRFSNSATVRGQILELAQQTSTSTGQTDFRAVDWLMGRRKTILVPVQLPAGTRPETLIRYARVVLAQQATIMRRLFWLGFLMSFATGIVAGAVTVAVILMK